MDDDLLTKSIKTGNTFDEPIFSVRSMFRVAFFGGPLAIGVYTLLNSHYLKRVRKDIAPVLVFLVICALSAYLFIPYLVEVTAADAASAETRRLTRWTFRIVALLYLGVYFLEVRSMYRAYDAAGREYRDPWVAAIASIVISIAFVSLWAYLGLASVTSS